MSCIFQRTFSGDPKVRVLVPFLLPTSVTNRLFSGSIAYLDENQELKSQSKRHLGSHSKCQNVQELKFMYSTHSRYL